jgi:hypothetical protein
MKPNRDLRFFWLQYPSSQKEEPIFRFDMGASSHRA